MKRSKSAPGDGLPTTCVRNVPPLKRVRITNEGAYFTQLTAHLLLLIFGYVDHISLFYRLPVCCKRFNTIIAEYKTRIQRPRYTDVVRPWWQTVNKRFRDEFSGVYGSHAELGNEFLVAHDLRRLRNRDFNDADFDGGNTRLMLKAIFLLTQAHPIRPWCAASFVSPWKTYRYRRGKARYPKEIPIEHCHAECGDHGTIFRIADTGVITTRYTPDGLTRNRPVFDWVNQVAPLQRFIFHGEPLNPSPPDPWCPCCPRRVRVVEDVG